MICAAKSISKTVLGKWRPAKNDYEMRLGNVASSEYQYLGDHDANERGDCSVPCISKGFGAQYTPPHTPWYDEIQCPFGAHLSTMGQVIRYRALYNNMITGMLKRADAT